MDNRMKIKWIIFGFIITWLFFSYKEAVSDDWSRKSVGQGVGGFLGVLSTQLMEINNPYALATGGLLGMFIGGEVGEHMDNTRDLHKIESNRCKEFITGDNRKGMACRENGEWVVVKMEN